MSLTWDDFRDLLRGRRGGIKSFLFNQKRIAGIGNVYGQDPLFKAGIHPLRPINTLSDEEVETLWQALRDTLEESIDLGGSQLASCQMSGYLPASNRVMVDRATCTLKANVLK